MSRDFRVWGRHRSALHPPAIKENALMGNLATRPKRLPVDRPHTFGGECEQDRSRSFSRYRIGFSRPRINFFASSGGSRGELNDRRADSWRGDRPTASRSDNVDSRVTTARTSTFSASGHRSRRPLLRPCVRPNAVDLRGRCPPNVQVGTYRRNHGDIRGRGQGQV